MTNFTYEGITYRMDAIFRIIAKKHLMEVRDGEKCCSFCKAVWPCPEFVLLQAYREGDAGTKTVHRLPVLVRAKNE